MCEYGNTVHINVPVDRFQSGDALEWERRPIDACIHQIVAALNAKAILTRSSCCGHGDQPGQIVLRDGRTLLVLTTDPTEGLPRTLDLTSFGPNQMVYEDGA